MEVEIEDEMLCEKCGHKQTVFVYYDRDEEEIAPLDKNDLD